MKRGFIFLILLSFIITSCSKDKSVEEIDRKALLVSIDWIGTKLVFNEVEDKEFPAKQLILSMNNGDVVMYYLNNASNPIFRGTYQYIGNSDDKIKFYDKEGREYLRMRVYSISLDFLEVYVEYNNSNIDHAEYFFKKHN